MLCISEHFQVGSFGSWLTNSLAPALVRVCGRPRGIRQCRGSVRNAWNDALTRVCRASKSTNVVGPRMQTRVELEYGVCVGYLVRLKLDRVNPHKPGM